MTSSERDNIEAQRARLDDVSFGDQRRLRKRLKGAGRIKDPKRRDKALDEISADIDKAIAAVERRRAAMPTMRFPEQLPISSRRAEILDAIVNNQIVVVAGETGSGKSTQLPKICVEAGLGARGMIGHTQRWLLGAIRQSHRQEHLDQGDDRRHPAGRDAARP